MAKEIIVAVNGSDNGAGTLANPYKTLAKALEAAEAGDTISLRAGQYLGGVTVRKENITIQSYGSEKAHIATPNNSASDDHDWSLRFGATASGGTLKNIEVSGGNYYTVKLETQWEYDDPDNGDGDPTNNIAASNITIQNCILHDSGRDVIKITPGCDNVRILNNEIYNSGRPGGVQNDRNAEGIDVVNADNLIIRGNHIFRTATTGLYFKGGSRNALVEDNYIHDTGLSSDPSPNSGAGIGIGYYTDNDFFDPTNTGYFETFDAIVRNNTIVNTKDAGIMIFASHSPQVYGNTLYNVAMQPWTAPGGIFIGGQRRDSDAPGLFVKTHAPLVRDNIVVLARDPDYREGYTGSSALMMYRNGDNTPSEVTGTINIDGNTYYQLGNPNGHLLFDGRDDFQGQFFQPISFTEWQGLGYDVNGHYFLPNFDANYNIIPGPGIDIPPTEDFDGTPGDGGGGGGGGGGDGGGNGGEVGDVEPGGPANPGGLPFGLNSISYDPGTSLANDSDLVMNFAAPVVFDYTEGTLRIVRETDGVIVGVVDFEAGQPGDGTTTVTVDLDAFNLTPGTTYSVVASNDFLGINMGPDWQIGPIQRGAYTFTTAGATPGGGPPGTPGGSPNTPGTPGVPGSGDPLPLDVFIMGTKRGDRLVGGDGNDEIRALEGHDKLTGGKGNDKLLGYSGNDSILGGAGNDQLGGSSGKDRLSGGDGLDFLKGGSGNDRLIGGAGEDQLWGEAGQDVLTGGGGRDTFVFSAKDTASNVDRVTDFSVRDDTIWLENLIFKGIGSGTLAKPKKLASDAFAKGPVANDAEDRIIYDANDGSLYYDRDGTGAAAQIKIAELSKGLALTRADFYVI